MKQETKMDVFTAHVITNSRDHYVLVFDYEPTWEDVVKRVHRMENAPKNKLQWYKDTLSISIEENVVLTKGK
jgi:hypothetical protein